MAQTVQMGRQEIVQLLTELDAEMHKRDVFVSLDIFGGSAIALAYSDARASQDIDARVNTANYNVFRQAVERIAERYSISGDWINEAVSTIVSEDMLLHRQEMQSIDFGLRNITIRIPSRVQLLAMKLFAARDKDVHDAAMLARALNIRSKAELEEVVKRYYKADSIKRQNRRKGGHNQIYNAINAVTEVLSNDV